MTTLRDIGVAWMIVLCAWAAPLHALDRVAASSQASRLWRLAAQEQATLEQRGILLPDRTVSDYVQAVSDRLWEQVHSNLKSPTIKVVTDTRMEAYAYPNGYCLLTTGILSQIENEDQLAMILAHELVHYARQHTVLLYDHFQMSIPGTGLSYARQTRSAGIPTMQQKIDAAEYQADEEGLTILKAAGYCEAEVLPLMSNLNKSLQDQGSTETIERLEKRIKNMRTIMGQTPERITCTSTADGGRDFFLNRITPVLLANAQAALNCGDWRQADLSISRFLMLKQDNARAYYLKGEIQRRRNDADVKNQCIGSYQKALEIDPEFPLAHRALGELNYKAGRFQTAKMHFEAFLSLAPQDHASEFIKGYLRQCQN
jgi:predicted Zn-dependent protease